MPIIPRQDNITSSVPTAGAPIPGIEAFTGTGQVLAAGLGKVSKEVEDVSFHQMHTQAILEADNARTKLSMGLDTLKDQILSAPPRLKANVGPEATDPEDESAAYSPGILQFQPKSETLMTDWVPAAQKARDDAMKSVSPMAQRYLQRHANTLYVTATSQMIGRQRVEQQHEMLAMAQDSINDVHRNIENMPPLGPTLDPNGLPVFSPNDPTVARYRQILNQKMDLLAARGLDSKIVHDMRMKQLAKFDKDWAAKEMHNDPDAWDLSVENKTNGWHSQLDEGLWDRLKEQSGARIKKLDAQEEKLRKLAIEGAERDLGKQKLANSLTDDSIRAYERILPGEKIVYWQAQRVNQDFDWPGDPAITMQAGIKARSRDVPKGYDRELDRLFYQRHISNKDHQEFSANYRQTIQKREDVAQAKDWHEESDEERRGRALLTPQTRLLMDKQDLWANLAAWQNKFTTMKNEGMSPREINQKILPDHLSRAGDLVAPLAENAAKAVPELRGKFNQELGFAPEDLRAAKDAAYREYGVDPLTMKARLRAGSVPSGLVDRLRAIEEAKEFASYATGQYLKAKRGN